MRMFLKGALVGGIGAAAIVAVTAAIAGTGVGGVFNLGQTNGVNATSALAGATSGPQAVFYNASTASNALGAAVYGKSTGAPALKAQNLGAGPALGLNVAAGNAPFTVNSATKVAGLNADQLDGLSSENFVHGTGSALFARVSIATPEEVKSYTNNNLLTIPGLGHFEGTCYHDQFEWGFMTFVPDAGILYTVDAAVSPEPGNGSAWSVKFSTDPIIVNPGHGDWLIGTSRKGGFVRVAHVTTLFYPTPQSQSPHSCFFEFSGLDSQN